MFWFGILATMAGIRPYENYFDGAMKDAVKEFSREMGYVSSNPEINGTGFGNKSTK